MKNLFIAFEGIDGAGKTTLAGMTAHTLGYSAMNSVPDFLRPALMGVSRSNSPLSTFHFFSLCNSLRSKEIEEQILKTGVIIDRYIFSTYAYHRLMLGKNIEESIAIYKDKEFGFRFPDITFFVTASKDAVSHRIRKREQGSAHRQWYGDAVSLSMDVTLSYLETFKKFGIPYIHIDTTDRSAEEVHSVIIKHILEKFAL